MAEDPPREGRGRAGRDDDRQPCPFGRAGVAPVIRRRLGDAAVAEGDEVVDGQAQPLVVGGAYDVEGAVAGRPGHDHDRLAGGELGEVGRVSVRSEQNERLAAVLQQAHDGAPFVAGGGDGAQRQLVADPVGSGVEAADEVAVLRTF